MHFNSPGVAAEPIQVILHVPGYQLTPRDRVLKFRSDTAFIKAKKLAAASPATKSG